MREVLPWIPAKRFSFTEAGFNKGRSSYVTDVVTLTLFSHSNSVHILRNWYDGSTHRLWFRGTNNYLCLSTVCWLDVIHNINVDVVQDDALLGHSRSLPQDASEDNAGFCRRNFDSSFYTLEAMRCDGIHGRPLHELQIAQSREI